MGRPYQDHLIRLTASVKEALSALNTLASDAILFVVDENQKLLGSLTDGDLRRGFLRDLTFDTPLQSFLQSNPKFVRKGGDSIEKIIAFRNGNFKIIPVLNEQNRVVNVINFRFFKSYLPLDAVIMAGGRGERLRPFTDQVPKPLLKVRS